MEELSLKKGVIITLEEEEIVVQQGIIYVDPAWKFLLNNQLNR